MNSKVLSKPIIANLPEELNDQRFSAISWQTRQHIVQYRIFDDPTNYTWFCWWFGNGVQITAAYVVHCLVYS